MHGTGANLRLDRHAGVLVLEGTGHPRHQPQLVIAARAAKQLDLGHRERVEVPISVVRVRDGYAVRDGHHRVSVARARGALTIDAAVEAG